jgi:hypothetical protein
MRDFTIEEALHEPDCEKASSPLPSLPKEEREKNADRLLVPMRDFTIEEALHEASSGERLACR